MAEQSDPSKVAAALVDLAKWLEAAQGDAGWLAALRFGVAGALAETPHKALAEAGFRQIIAQSPQHLWAWVGLISLVLARGDAGQAAALGQTALGHLPQDPILRRKTAEALEQADGPDAAIAFLDPLGRPPAAAEDLGHAISLFRAAQRVAEALPLCDRLLALRPDDAMALLARIEACLAQGADAKACKAALAAMACHPDHDEIRLRAAQAHLRMGLTEQAAVFCATDPGDPGLAGEFAALRRALSGNATPPPTKPPEPSIGSDAPVPWYRVLADISRAVEAGDARLAQDIAMAADRSTWSEPERQAFALEDCLLRHGPRAALDLARQNPVGRRDHEAAERLGRVVLMAGCGRLAARYLWFCARHWPDNPALLQLACKALHCAGLSDRVDTLLDQTAAAQDPGRVLDLRLSAAMHLGRGDRLREICAAVSQGEGSPAPLAAMLRAYLLSGDLAQAEACLAQMRRGDGGLEEALIQRPRATWLGSLLNEARILAAAGGADGTAQDSAATTSFLRARQIAAGLCKANQGAAILHATATGMPPPRPVHFLWPGFDPSKADHQRIIAAWAAQLGPPGDTPTLEDGARWLAERHGKPAAQAYRMAPQPEQRADLLCYGRLLAEGGIALCAPQWPSDDFAQWIGQQHGAIFLLDPVGAVSTDLIIAPAGHPVIATAFEWATQACRARESDHRWFKTGPGLLTRAFATAHAQPGSRPEATMLLPEHLLRRYLHPYGPVAQHPMP